MVKDTFYNLKEEKKQRITAGALEVFAHLPLNQVTVTDIVQATGIARGSFYQYFDNVEDVFFLIVSIVRAKKQLMLEELITEFDGDIFEITIATFENECDFFLQQEHQLLINMFQTSNVAFEDFNFLKQNLGGCYIDEMIQKINPTNLKFNSQQELKLLISMLMRIVMENISSIALDKVPREQAIENLKIQLGFIRNGVCI
ncbi:MAG: hypothetical protein ATN36_03990 [Epulopiscium sp. Nele67-Bin005]|nr:MAG: hypothetical protein ATN36_03990 [Epulopiscium sp. Nele67-Bin005]